MQMVTQATWTARLLHRHRLDWSTTVRASAAGLALSACYGVALGARHGVAAMGVGAVGVPLGLAAIVIFGGPALYIGLAHAGVPLSPRGLGSTLASTTCVAGLVLGGLAPAVTLVSVSVDTHVAAAVLGHAGLALGIVLAMGRMVREMRLHLGEERVGRRGAHLATVAFAVFATALAERVWWVAIPMLGRGA